MNLETCASPVAAWMSDPIGGTNISAEIFRGVGVVPALSWSQVTDNDFRRVDLVIFQNAFGSLVHHFPVPRVAQQSMKVTDRGPLVIYNEMR